MGLLIGSIGDDSRDSVVAVIATPAFEVHSSSPCCPLILFHVLADALHNRLRYTDPVQEGQQTIEVSEASLGAGKKGKNSKASPEPQVHIKVDWIHEHASQVAPLLPGGTACP